MSSILKCTNIYREFKKDKRESLKILKDVSLEIEGNKISVIVGASGAGKSTLLHILGGLDKPTSGNVYLGENELYNMDDDRLSDIRNKEIGFVFQFHHLLPEFSALENINIPQLIAGKSEADATKRSKQLLEIVGLSEREDHKPSELSGGEQQRIAVARALANNPRIILADEPTGNLDTNNSEILNKLFLQLKKEFNYTFLIVTHNNDLMNIGDRVIEMKDGKLISD